MVAVIVGAGGHGQDIAAVMNLPMVDEDPDVGLPLGDPGPYIAGVNDPTARHDMAHRLEGEGWEAYDDGIVVFPGVYLGPDVWLGRHVHVNVGAFLTRCTVGDFTTVAPEATVLGDVTIGARCMIGANATIRNLVTVCDDVTVGCGAVVVKDIDDPGVYAGNPARRLR